MTAYVIRGDARRLPLPDASVDLIVTSPPYWSLRSYTDNGQHYDGQIGSEPTPQAYVAALLVSTREWMRVLKPEGSIFVDLGDKYAGGGQGGNIGGRLDGGEYLNRTTAAARTVLTGARAKSRLLLPERYRIGCADELGLIVRAVIVWSKPNGLPESVADRVRAAHEDIVHLVKQPRYYSAVDEIRQPASGYTRPREASRSVPSGQRRRNMTDSCNPLGALPGSVWEIATQPLTVPPELGVDHYAAFPAALPRRIIQGWSPPGICTACGQGRRPVSEVRREVDRYHARQNLGKTFGERTEHQGKDATAAELSTLHMQATRTITGYVCACPEPTAPTRPAVVLDPFGGTGTTALVASILGRRGVSVDRSADYCRLAAWRTTDPGERARAAQLPKPPVIPAAQLDLLGDLT